MSRNNCKPVQIDTQNAASLDQSTAMAEQVEAAKSALKNEGLFFFFLKKKIINSFRFFFLKINFQLLFF